MRRGTYFLVIALVGLFALPSAVALLPTDTGGGPMESIEETIDQAHHQKDAAVDFVEAAANPHGSGGDGNGGGGRGGDHAGAPGLADGVLDALMGPAGLAALGVLAAAGLAGGGFLLATRYVDPKLAMENPQRAMLYGYIRGNPGVNLKTLSDDFAMKTSTVLWHIRKLEGADLVRSTKANGFRVFYPVAGGIEAKQLGSAVAALANDNAARILDYVAIHPGAAQKGLVNALDINAGTVRWHLRKLKDTGLMAELPHGRSSTYYPTELGLKALRQTMGGVVEVQPAPAFAPEAGVVE